jgi:hypothetical protein
MAVNTVTLDQKRARFRCKAGHQEGNLTPSSREDSLRSYRVIGPRADDIVDYQIEVFD